MKLVNCIIKAKRRGASKLSALLFSSGAMSVTVEEDAEGGGIRVTAMIDAEDTKRFGNILSVYDVSFAEIEDRNWEDAWIDRYQPIYTEHFVVIPESFKGDDAEPREYVIRIDPRGAFGAGTHATTRLCLEALCRMVRPLTAPTVADIGTGSGIIAVAAEKLGAAAVFACDNDERAIETARRNLSLNGCVRTFTECRVLEKMSGATRYDCVVANIHSSVIESNFELLKSMVLPQGCMIVSGIGEEWLMDFCRSCELSGLIIHETAVEEGWCCCVLMNPPKKS